MWTVYWEDIEMNETYVIKLLSLFRTFYEGAGVDYEQMIEILKLKLIMDRRRVNVIAMQGEVIDDGKNQFKKSMIVTLIMGIMVGFILLLPVSIFLSMQIFILMFLTLLSSIFISDYSSILLDLRQKEFFMTRPIDVKTMSAAKLTHIILYISTYALALAAAGIAIGTFRHGAVFLGMSVVTVLLTVIFSVVISSFGYAILLRFFTGEKLRDIINYFQVGVSVFLMVSYQVVPRLIGFSPDLQEVRTYPTLLYLLPSTFLAAPYQLLFEHQTSAVIVVACVASVVVPVLLLLLYLTKVMPYFERNLYRLSTASRRNRGRFALWRTIVALTGSNPEEKNFMRFYLLLFGRERRLKLQVLPQVTFACIFPYVFVFNTLDKGGDILQQLRQEPFYLNIYISAFTVMILYSLFEISNRTERVNSYLRLPIRNRANLYTAGLKAVCLKYVVPMSLFHCFVFGILCQREAYIDLVLIFSNTINIFLLANALAGMELPLSQEENLGKSIRVQRFFLSLPVAAFFVVIHLWSVFYSSASVRLVLAALSLILVILLVSILLRKIIERRLTNENSIYR